jgi:hypothetical protein
MLSNQWGREIGQDAVSELRLPPEELSGLVVDGGATLVGEDIGQVAVDGVSEGVALRLSSLEVSPLDNGRFGGLNPLVRISEFGESG